MGSQNYTGETYITERVLLDADVRRPELAAVRDLERRCKGCGGRLLGPTAFAAFYEAIEEGNAAVTAALLRGWGIRK